MHPLAAASLVVLAGLAGLNGVAWVLYRQGVFWKLGLGWILNALYLVIDTSIQLDNGPQEQAVLAYLVSLPSTFFFFFAFVDCHSHKQNPRAYAALTTTKWLFLIAAGYVLANSLQVIPPSARFEVTIAPGVLFTAWVLARLGRCFWRKTSYTLLTTLRGGALPERITAVSPQPSREQSSTAFQGELPRNAAFSANISRLLLSVSFFAYSAVQLLYFFRADYPTSMWIHLAFYTGFSCKVIQLCGVATLLFSDVQYVNHILRMQTVAEELGALTASIEHDINTPISILRKKLHLLRNRYQRDRSLVDQLSLLENQILRIRAAADIIPALREGEDYYRQKSQKWNLVSLARTAINDVQKTFESKQPRITLNSSTSVITISAYRERLLQSLVNILNNAVEACLSKHPDKSPSVEVSLSTRKENAEAILAVVDHGTGIPKEILPWVARPMFSTKTEGKVNRGVGLFISRRIVEQHGGNLIIESDGQSYTRVTIELPTIES